MHIGRFDRLTRVKIVKGPHKGKWGRIVSVPWLANLWNLRPTINLIEMFNQEDCWTSKANMWVTVWDWELDWLDVKFCDMPKVEEINGRIL